MKNSKQLANMSGDEGGDGPNNNHNHTSLSNNCDDDSNNNKKVYKGVRKRKWGKWVSEIRLPNSRERIWLGSYDSPEKAARAFDAALYCLRGCRANFNFPDTPFNLSTSAVHHHSLTHQEIQEIAASFAHSQDPHHDDHQQEQPNSNDNDSSSVGLLESKADAAVVSQGQVDNNMMMDWTFLKDLGGSCSADCGGALYSDDELDRIDHHYSGDELLFSVPTFQDNVADDDPFFNQSFLWNWSF
ncbi:ethylene-responsive transcription factor ERF017-like [Arachis stenosperma]|uniref:ethylene-responsive transcription factor ERF017-like n=1 Tax=Arachis stenosperma TaxID=217475 RepID=UPI0025AD4225|nr:ethylene-responsive transcription factor ERF017-like [Arachis stenosperma]